MDENFAKLVEDLPVDPYSACNEVISYLGEIDFEKTDSLDDHMYLKVVKHLMVKAGHPVSEYTGSPVSQLKDIASMAGIIRADSMIAQLEAKASFSSGDSFGYAVLTPEEKEDLHVKLEEIRQIIDASNLDDRKKNQLSKRLNALAKEVDKNGTSTDRFFAFLGDLASVAGQMTEKAQPMIDEYKEVLEIVYKNRAKVEGIEYEDSNEILKITKAD